MTNLSVIPQEDGYSSNLSQEWDGEIGTMFLKSAPNFTMPVGETCYGTAGPTGSNAKLFEFDSIDTGNNTINITNVTLFKGAGIANPTGITYPTNSEVIISDNYQFWSDIKDAINSKLNNDGTNTTTTWDLQVGGSSFRIRLDSGNMKFTDDFNVEISLSQIAAASGADRKVAVTLNDTTPGNLGDKIVGGDGIVTDVLNPAADEDFEIAIDLITTNGLKITAGQLDIEPSTTSQIGTSIRATDAENTTRTDTTKYVTPKHLAVQGIIVSDNLKASADTERTDSTSVLKKVKEIEIGSYRMGGTVRVKVDGKEDGGGGVNDLFLYINGILETSFNVNTGYVTFTDDITVSEGDLVQIYMEGDISPATTVFAKNFRIYYDEVDFTLDPTVNLD